VDYILDNVCNNSVSKHKLIEPTHYWITAIERVQLNIALIMIKWEKYLTENPDTGVAANV